MSAAQITVNGTACPLLTREEATAAGMTELTTGIRVEAEAYLLTSIIGSVKTGHQPWALTLSPSGRRGIVHVWRAVPRVPEFALP